MKCITDKDSKKIPLGSLISIINRYYGVKLDKETDHFRGQIPFLIALLEENNVSQDYFAHLFNMNEGTVARTVEKLEKNDLIIRKVDECNKRKKIIYLTDKGRKNALKFKSLDKKIEEKLFEDFSKESIENSKKILKKIAINAINLCEDDFEK